VTSQFVSVLKKKKALSISTKLDGHTVHGSQSSGVDPEVKRSRSHGYQMCCWCVYACQWTGWVFRLA